MDKADINTVVPISMWPCSYSLGKIPIRVTTKLYIKSTIIFVNFQSTGVPDTLHPVSSYYFKCRDAVVFHYCFIQLFFDDIWCGTTCSQAYLSSVFSDEMYIEVLGCSLTEFWRCVVCFGEQTFSIGIFCKYFLPVCHMSLHFLAVSFMEERL